MLRSDLIRARRALNKAAGVRMRRGKIPKQRFPNGVRLEYQTFLGYLRERFKKVLEEEFLPALPGIVDRAKAELQGLRNDASVDELQALFARLRLTYLRLVPIETIEDKLRYIGEELDKKQKVEHLRQVKAATGIEILTPEPWKKTIIDRFIAENQNLVESLAEDQFKAFQRITTQGIRSGLRVETIRDQLIESLGISKGKASLLARDQTLKLFGELAETRQKAVGVEKYIWSTSNDERVRPRHADLEGTEQRWSDPPIVDPRSGRRAHPGGDYQCRCQALPVFEYT